MYASTSCDVNQVAQRHCLCGWKGSSDQPCPAFGCANRAPCLFSSSKQRHLRQHLFVHSRYQWGMEDRCFLFISHVKFKVKSTLSREHSIKERREFSTSSFINPGRHYQPTMARSRCPQAHQKHGSAESENEALKAKDRLSHKLSTH